MNIKQLVYLLILIGVLIAVVFSTGYYYFLQKTILEKMNEQSINRAHRVAKRVDAIYDRIAYRFYHEEAQIYKALEISQLYFQENGKNASLLPLQKLLNNRQKGLIYNVYLINSDYVIEKSTFKPDIGLDFKSLPYVHTILQNVFSQKIDTDLSEIIYDGVARKLRRYIVQKSKTGDYLIQIGLSFKDEYSLVTAIKKIQADVPSLLNSNVYQLFMNSEIPFNIERQWSSQPVNISKREQMMRDDDFNIFKTQVAPILGMDVSRIERKTLTQYFSKEMINTLDYKDVHLWKEDRYVHRIIMPFMSFRNHFDISVNLLVMEFDHSEVQHVREMMMYITWGFWIFFILLIGIMIWILRYRVLDPLSMMRLKMKTKEPVSFETIPELNDEIGSITRTYNQLLEDLQREIASNKSLYEEFKIFSGNAIHQIRTPLSVIKIALEMIKTADEEAKKRIRSSLVSIEHMYDSLSYMVRHDKVEYTKEQLDLSELFERRCKIFNVVAETNDMTLKYYIEPDLMVMINPYEAEYLIDNNLSNAIKYGEHGTTINLSLRRIKDEIELRFENYGKPIKDVEIIFQRYKREDYDQEGSGIGLNMVKTICERNNILIQVDYHNAKNRFIYHIQPI